jgi:hypothetical protein
MVCPRTPSYSLFNNESNEHLIAISTFASTKRKASSFDSENADPIQFPRYKKFKSHNGYPDHFSVAIKYPVTSPRRLTLHTCSPAPRLNTSTTPKSISLIVLAGRSPSRKRFGILNRGKTAPLCTHAGPRHIRAYVDLGFSIDAALSSTTSSYDKCDALSQEQKLPVSKDSWIFDIHEDTPEELESNMMEHSICTLDISSDEESSAKMKDKGKENIPPHDDISQTYADMPGQIVMAESSRVDIKVHAHTSVRRQRQSYSTAGDIDRAPLSELAAGGFYG